MIETVLIDIRPKLEALQGQTSARGTPAYIEEEGSYAKPRETNTPQPVVPNPSLETIKSKAEYILYSLSQHQNLLWFSRPPTEKQRPTSSDPKDALIQELRDSIAVRML